MIECDICGAKHAIDDLEPRYQAPVPALQVPDADREHCVMLDRDWCCVRDREDTWRRYFFRALLPFDVEGDDEPCCWGIWVEVSHEDYKTVGAHWQDPDQRHLPRVAAKVAVSAPGYDETMGLPGRLQLTGPDTAPVFEFDVDVAHALAQEQRDGVTRQRVLAWMHALEDGR